MAKKQIPACAYIRMSTGKQDKSPAQQRAEVEKLAKREGYVINQWFADEGISGDKTSKRDDFLAMVAACSNREFAAILSWDQDRFGRFDSIEAGIYIDPIRNAGVWLHTCTDGKIDFSDRNTRMIYAMKQEAKNAFLTDLSANVTRGLRSRAGEGLWLGQSDPPFGYVADSDKRLQLAAPRIVETVGELFERYADGESISQLLKWLADGGILTTAGKPWSRSGLRYLLSNSIYTGHYEWFKTSKSKYKHGNRECKKIEQPEDAWVVIERNHPAIVSQELFDRCQEQKAANRKRTAPRTPTALSGLVKCGKCGGGMSGGRDRGKVDYICTNGKQKLGVCEPFRLREDEIMPEVLRVLHSEYFDKFTPETIEAIKAEIRRQVDGKADTAETDQRQLADIERKIQKAADRLLEIDADMIPHVTASLRRLEVDRDAVRARIDAASKPSDVQANNAEQRIRTALAWLDDIEAITATDYDPGKLNRMLRQFIDKIELELTRTAYGATGNRHKTTITGGRIYLKIHGLSPHAIREAAPSFSYGELVGRSSRPAPRTGSGARSYDIDVNSWRWGKRRDRHFGRDRSSRSPRGCSFRARVGEMWHAAVP